MAFDYSTNYREAAVILFPIALLGFISNLLVITFLRKISGLKNAFGLLTLSQASNPIALADCAAQFIFAFYVAPCIFLHNYDMFMWSEHFGFALILCYEICGLSHVCISLNRFVAVFVPLMYPNIFTTRFTLLLIAFYWIVATILACVNLKFLDCVMLLPFEGWQFLYKDSEICMRVQWYAAFLKYVTYTAIVGLLDFVTVVRFHYLNIRNRNKTRDAASTVRHKREMNLVQQTALQGIVFITELITYFVLSNYTNDRWVSYLLTTVAWCAVYGLDGFIVLSFNRDFRRKIKEKVFRMGGSESTGKPSGASRSQIQTTVI